jgi:ribose 5-phosphate isomerase B
MKIALASDHAGFQLKQGLVTYLRDAGHEIIDLGVDSDATRADYPDVAKAIGDAVLNGKAERGVLLCGSGVGASVAANKIQGIYAAICHDVYSAAQGVEHDNMNVLCLGGRIIGISLAEKLVDAFLNAQFNTETGRYQTRFKMIQDMEASS